MVSRPDFDSARERARALAERTSLGVGGTPRFFFEPEDEADCAKVLCACADQGVPLFILGGGYNLLVRDDHVAGAVLSTRLLRAFEVADDRIEVGAGYSFPALVRKAIDLGVPGLAGCPGIPGSVGGRFA